MLIDFRDASVPDTLSADVCIAGAGAAGVTLARALASKGRTVCLLEAGGLDFEPDTQGLYEGANLGMEYYPLAESRLRFLGGTTNIWGGRCVPLDPIDFRKRSWVPHSGWPIGPTELAPYYRLAHQDLGLGEYNYDESMWQRTGLVPTDFSAGTFASTFWRFDARQERFGASGSTDLAGSDAITLILHANVVYIQASQIGDRIDSVEIANLFSSTATVRARHFVLACGAIENARLLLCADDIQRQGLGNSHDQVGRYFMEHPHARLGRVETQQAFSIWSAYRKRYPTGDVAFAPAVVATDAMQERLGILNTALTFKLQRDPGRGAPLNKKLYLKLKHDLHPTRTGRKLWYAYRQVRNLLQRNLRTQVERLRAGMGLTDLQVIVRAEQAPNPLSRVVLSRTTDALGVRQADLDWQLGELDKQTVSRLAAALNEEYQRLQIGRVIPSPWLAEPGLEWPVDPTVSNHPIGGYHHMGTTRMSDAPTDGVVNSDCQVHGLDNLYIAGSSVFATAGWGNPTLTLLALAHRLSDHLNARF